MKTLIKTIRSCTICSEHLPLGPRPLLQASAKSKIVIIGQAPGKATHQSGKPWDDKSGEKLRQWLGVEDTTFYNPDIFAHIPMGFCYPGKGKSGDLPPRKECAIEWHNMLFQKMKHVQVKILIGGYAQKYYLKKEAKSNLTKTVFAYHEYLPEYFPLVHPSPLNFRWFAKNPWLEEEVIPGLKHLVERIISK